MRILLINPPNCGRSIPEERYGITSIKKIFRSEPLALEALAGNLYGHEVRIVDLKVESFRRTPVKYAIHQGVVIHLRKYLAPC